MGPELREAKSSESPPEVDAFSTSGAIKQLATIWLTIVLILLAGSLANREFITLQFLAGQDLWLLSLQVLVTAAILVAGSKSRQVMKPDRLTIPLLVIVVICLCYAGHYWLLLGHDLIRDEQMTSFDMAIYARGHLAWPIPAGWRQDAAALNLMFMLPASEPLAWVSSYLPINAALRALLGTFADPALASPLFTGLSLPLLWSCARRIWPNDREAAVVSTLLLGCSGQFLVMGMTVYAMPAHLFFNLLWLRLFMVDRRGADLAALLVGFLATGLHQPLFHPMFVAPFMLLLILERRWGRLALFTIIYAAIFAFWLAWPLHVSGLISGAEVAQAAAGAGAPIGTDYWTRLMVALGQSSSNAQLMAANLLRFFTWQHVLLLPLMLASWGAVCKNRMAGALAAGFLLPIAVMAIILPWQGVGFGYRYVHGVLGNAALLGGFGWQRLATAHRQLRPAFVKATAASALVLFPLQAWMVHRLYAPYAVTNEKIDTIDADYIVIGIHDTIWADSLVINRPDLSNRPIRLYAEKIEHPEQLATRICKPGKSIALPTDQFFAPIAAIWGDERAHFASDRLPSLSALFQSKGCSVRVLQ